MGVRRGLGAVIVGIPLIAAPSAAGSLLTTDLALDQARDRSCSKGLRGLPGARAQRLVRTPAAGWIKARLAPIGRGSGDWDVAVFDRRSRRLVAASAGFGSAEVASGPVAQARQLVVQACRRSGSGRARLDVGFEAQDGRPSANPSLVRVSTPNRARRQELAGLGLDLTEHGGRGFMDVVLHGETDARKLRRSKFIYATRVRDLVAQNQRRQAADARFAASVRASRLPSGRTRYRRLADYGNDMKRLVRENPGLVRPLTLPLRTYEGRSVEGIEISDNVGARDGKPVFLQLGLHHAREWPSGEHALEWAFELVSGWRSGDARVRRLLRATRTIVVPVVNPDGFNASREAGELQGAGGGRGGSETVETVNIVSHPNEYRRKNCRLIDDSPSGNCNQPSLGLVEAGVDPNRNYGALWGGPGASTDPTAQDYRGPGPFSEPETRNVRSLISKRQVTVLITNHTFSNLILRPPGLQSLGAAPDETALKALGDAMARQNGYTSQFGFQLYDTSGTTEDWSYLSTGGFGYTFEIGPNNFHPPFAETVAEYEGTTEAAKGGKGNREAYFIALEGAANPAGHSLLRGKAPEGAVLRLRKSFKTPTSPVIDVTGGEGPVRSFGDVLETTMEVPRSGRFRWHLNPSTRPLVGKARGRLARGRPSSAKSFASDGPGATVPCGEATAPPPTCYEDHLVTVPRGAGIDNARATVRIDWNTPVSDWDMVIYRANAAGQATGPPLSSSAQGTTTFEETTLSEPFLPDRFVVRVINFAAIAPVDLWTGRVTFGGPPAPTAAKTESWTFTCEGRGGRVGLRRSITIRRGQALTLDLSVCAPVACVSTRRGVRGNRLGPVRLGRSRKRNRRFVVSRRLKSRRKVDRYCVAGGGTLRVAYPTRRLARRLSRSQRRAYRRRAVLLVTSSKRFRVRRVRVGTRTRTARRRLRGERRVRVGKSVWYSVRGKRSRLLFRTRRGRVRDVAIAAKPLTRSRRSTRALLRSWGGRP